MKIVISVSDKEKTKGDQSPYYKALLAVGVKSEEIELVSPAQHSIPNMRDYDGVVFTGGKDINPKHYQEALRYPGLVEVNEQRDAFEFELFERAHRCRVAILGHLPGRPDDQRKIRRPRRVPCRCRSPPCVPGL